MDRKINRADPFSEEIGGQENKQTVTNVVSPVIYGSKTTGRQENKLIVTNVVSPVIYGSKTTSGQENK